MKPVKHFQGMSYMYTCKTLFQTCSYLVLACILGNLAFLEPVWAGENVARITLNTPDGGMAFLSVDGNTLGPGKDVVAKGTLQNPNGTFPLDVKITEKELQEVTITPALTQGPHPLQTYTIHRDGQPGTYKLEMETVQDDLTSNTLIHTGTITDESTGLSVDFVAVNDPVPVLVPIIIVIGILAAIICVVQILSANCVARATAVCGAAGVKSVTTSISITWRGLCKSKCNIVCNPVAVPTAIVAPTGVAGY